MVFPGSTDITGLRIEPPSMTFRDEGGRGRGGPVSLME